MRDLANVVGSRTHYTVVAPIKEREDARVAELKKKWKAARGTC